MKFFREHGGVIAMCGSIYISSYETSVISAVKQKRRFRLGRTRAGYRILIADMMAEWRVRNICEGFNEKAKQSANAKKQDPPRSFGCARVQLR